MLLIKGERHTPSQGTAASPRPSQPLLPLPAQDACGNAALAARIFPLHSGGRQGLGQQRTRLFIGIIKLPCNLTNDSGLNWLLLRPQSGKRKNSLSSRGHERTFNRFLSKSKRTHTLSPFATQMKQMKNGWLIKNTALEKTNQETCFSLNGPHIFLLLKIIWSPGD